jgi:two-component system, OmpR family, sensor histidine kinase KdpD
VAGGFSFSQRAKHALLGSAGVAIVTGACFRLHATLAIAGFLFLLTVLAQSLLGDFLTSVLVSIECVVCLDFFFTKPLYSLEVTNGIDVIALSCFLATALVVTRLVSRVTAEAYATRLERRRLARLYRLAQQLLAMGPQRELGARFLERFQIVFGIRALSLFDADTAELYFVGESASGLAERTREAYFLNRDLNDPESSVWVRRLQVGGETTGCIGFEGLEEPQFAADALSTLAASFLGSTHSLRRASEAAAAADAETYRSAILDALAHEFKTPLATISAAAGGLRAAGPLRAEQAEMAETVETEAARLGRLTSRLLRMARLDREEVQPRMQPIEVKPLIEELAEQFSRTSPDREIRLLPLAESLRIEADPELLRLAVGQLLENACKYSEPGSLISLEARDRHGTIGIRVANEGSSIADLDRPRIFDRFYRGRDSKLHVSGSGLGLYVARKIAVAHGGRLDLEDSARQTEVSFCLTLPAFKGETEHVVTTH